MAMEIGHHTKVVFADKLDFEDELEVEVQCDCGFTFYLNLAQIAELQDLLTKAVANKTGD